MTSSREKVIKRALTVSLVGNAILAVAKIITGVFANSLSVLGDGIDSSGDVLISVIALIAAYISSKPSDQDHPYGHSRAETSATTILAFIIFLPAPSWLSKPASPFLAARNTICRIRQRYG